MQALSSCSYRLAVLVGHQAPYQKHSATGFGTQFGWLYDPDYSKVHCSLMFQYQILISHQLQPDLVSL